MSRIVLSSVPLVYTHFRHGPNSEVFPNIGLGHVAGAAASAGHEVLCLDPIVDGSSCRSLAKKVRQYRPEVVGFSCYTQDIDNASVAAEAIKADMPETFIVVGGYHPSAVPVQTIEQYPCFDAVVYGEGELSIVELLRVLENGGDLASVKGLCFRSQGTAVANPPRPQVPDLDALPFPLFDGLPLSAYNRFYSWVKGISIPICTARGCPYSCTFCYRLHGSTVRARSADNVLDEMEHDIARYGAKNIFFVDETFTLNKDRTARLCEAILGRGLQRKVRWLCCSRVDAVTYELLKLMKEAGCALISFGIESGNQDTLERCRKKILLDQVKTTLEWCRKCGIATATAFIIGHPGETEDKINQTINFAVKVKPTYCNFCIMTPFPGTEIAAMAERGEGGLVLLSRDWRTYGKSLGGALELASVDRRRLESLQRKAYAKFYLRPSRVRRLFEMASPGVYMRYMWHTLKENALRMTGMRDG